MSHPDANDHLFLGERMMGALSETELAPKPTDLSSTGLSQWLLADLLCKHLLESGVLDLGELAQRLRLPGKVVEELLHFLREEGRVELRSRRDNSPLLRFGLTERGRAGAIEASQKDGYVGPAPVTLEQYSRLVGVQSTSRLPATRESIRKIFADTVIRPELLDRLGPAVHSGRAIFIYGEPGTGKSYMARRLKRALGAPVLLPHAIAVGDSVIRYFDPSLHIPVDDPDDEKHTGLHQGFDARFVRCERPLVVAGGELTMDLLELQYDRSTRQYGAPLQLLANCGLFVIDDLGRQQINVETLLNRWIMPMEEKYDQLALNNGRHFSVPFDLALVFSTNLEPRQLADEAFLRRIGYKIRFEPASLGEYEAIWKQVCEGLSIEFDPALFAFLVDKLHSEQNTPMMQCYPRDVLQLASDYSNYNGNGVIDSTALRWAWSNYFLEI